VHYSGKNEHLLPCYLKIRVNHMEPNDYFKNHQAQHFKLLRMLP